MERFKTKVCFGTPSYKIYTDASKDDQNVGTAIAACDGDYVIHENYTSLKELNVHQAEMLAIKEALSWIKSFQDPLERKVEIYSDSQSAVTVLSGHEAKDKLSLETMLLMKQLPQVTVTWVKGHSDNTGNELADMLARIGAERAKDLAYTTPFMPLNYNALKRLVGEKYEILSQKAWEAVADCKISHQFIPEVKYNKLTSQLSSVELQQLSQIMTGHGLFKRHLRHWNELPEEDFSCMLCGEDWEDSWHLWALCPNLIPERIEISSYLKNNGKLKERALLKFFSKKKLVHLMAANEALLTP